uniref:Transposase (Putative), gypsy type n=1 Tax=Tanacetum cinerariifolium TaxID=118510 RepID=A0A699GV37_TANCI|nr:hypothetical protein [Tanacetum cinerariifolium]
MVIGAGQRMKSCTRPSNEIISCTIKGKPLVLSWGRTSRLDSGVRVRAHVCQMGPSGTLIRQGSTCDRDLRMLIPFRECLFVRERYSAAAYLSMAFLCIGSRYYTLDEDTYLEFLGDNDEEVDLLSFIRTANPTKVRVAERQRVENEPRLLESTVERVVLLLPIAPARASNELEASIDKLFDEGASGMDKSLFTGVVLNVEARGEPIPTLPFVTSSVSATPEREDKSPANFVTELNLRTIGAPQRFVISSDSSHHSDANIANAEVDSIVRYSAPAIATVTTVITMVDADTTADRVPVEPSFFSVGSSSTGRTNFVPGGFSDVSGSDFLIGGIRTIVDPDSDIQQEELLKVRDGEIESLKAQLLLKEAEAAKAIRLRSEGFKFKAAEKYLQGEVGVLRDYSATLEREKNKLSVKVTDLSASVKVREQEVADLDAQVTAIKLQNDNLVDQRFLLPGFKRKLLRTRILLASLRNFKIKIEEVNEKFDKLCVDFVNMALHLEEKFYPHLLTTISRRRWLLTHGMELAVVGCLNSTEYVSALGATIRKAIEKGMQEGLSAGITHGAEGRKLADVAAYNPSEEADYLFALQRLQNVNFFLIAKLKSNKDAIVDTIMYLLRLDDALTERLGLTESQPHANQLMVPIHHSPDQRVVGASALSLSLDVSHSRVKKIRENIASHVLALRGVFVPLSEPLSATALEGTKGTTGSAHDTTTTLSVTFVSAGTIPPISTDDYEVAHADGQGMPVWMMKPQLLGT